ncbi:MAG: hypothetical protein H0W35_04615 [Actinobacteria bacterium]|nr:hypothetical protein [Actinomycetota bacterium]MBA3561987.1 hypothetical protein [Actinomycetota bacterium]MBA3566122.1 hypothetical protein [Actinomycetota bacterium]MDQ3425545.1 DUF3179 domain-containing protein [Actinomycetota bacterium]
MRSEPRHVRILAAVGVVLTLALAGCGGSEESTPSDEELGRIAEEINKTVPIVGLGEASPPPPGAAAWETDFSKRLVPLGEFRPGGPPKDGIPAIDDPHFTRAEAVGWLEGREP